MKEKRLIRKLVLSSLVSQDLGGELSIIDPDGFEEIPERILNEAKELLNGIISEKGNLDKIISDNLKSRKVEYIGTVEKAVLRLATYELLYIDVPPKVSISEAIILTKLFANEKSSKFVNGVLRGIYNYLREIAKN